MRSVKRLGKGGGGVGSGLLLLGIIVADLLLLMRFDGKLLAVVLAFVTMFIFFHAIRRNILWELAITGSFLTFLFSYHFYFQPVFSDALPPLTDSIMLFFGSVMVIRGSIAIGKYTGIPGFREFAMLMNG